MNLLGSSKKIYRVGSTSRCYANSGNFEFNTHVEVSQREENCDEESPIEETAHDGISNEVSEERVSQEEEEIEEVPTLLEPLLDDAVEEQITRSKVNPARIKKWEIDLHRGQRRLQPYSRIVHEAYKQKKKKTRGMAKVETCIPIHGRGILQWNADGVPIGKWAPKFSRFIGCLAKRSELWHIARDWVDQPYSSFRDTWRDIQKHYKVENPNAWSFTFGILTNKILDWRTRLKSKYYEKYNNDKDRFSSLPNAIDPLQFAMLMNKWESDKFTEKSKISQKNCELKKMNHHLGGKSVACVAEEMNKYKRKLANVSKRTKKMEDENRMIKEALLKLNPNLQNLLFKAPTNVTSSNNNEYIDGDESDGINSSSYNDDDNNYDDEDDTQDDNLGST